MVLSLHMVSSNNRKQWFVKAGCWVWEAIVLFKFYAWNLF